MSADAGSAPITKSSPSGANAAGRRRPAGGSGRARSRPAAPRRRPRTVRWSASSSSAHSGWLGLGCALAVVAGDLGDDLDLLVGEPHQPVRVPDEVVAVLVVLGVGDDQADVGEQRRRLEQRPGVAAERRGGRRWRRTAGGRAGRRARSAPGPRRRPASGRRRCGGRRRAGAAASRPAGGRWCRGTRPRAGRTREITSSLMPKRCTTPSSTRAPARMMSARFGSRSGRSSVVPSVRAAIERRRPPRPPACG